MDTKEWEKQGEASKGDRLLVVYCIRSDDLMYNMVIIVDNTVFHN